MAEEFVVGATLAVALKMMAVNDDQNKSEIRGSFGQLVIRKVFGMIPKTKFVIPVEVPSFPNRHISFSLVSGKSLYFMRRSFSSTSFHDIPLRHGLCSLCLPLCSS